MKLLEKRKQEGQALLIILLVMAVVLTIALSVISRSVTDITISQKEEEAARAYSAAEAGIERTLLSGTQILSGSLPSGDQFSTEVSSLSSTGREYNIPLLMSSGETVPVWFIAHDDDNLIVCSDEFPCFTGSQIKLCWGEEGTSSTSSTTPAIELSIIYTTVNNDNSTAKVARAAFDPYVARPDANNFAKGSDGSCTVDGRSFAFSKSINFSDLNITIRPQGDQNKGSQNGRLKIFYNTDRAQPVGIVVTSAEGILPKQGNKVAATGQSGQSSRKVEVYQLYSDLPPVFDYGIFSGTGGITK